MFNKKLITGTKIKKKRNQKKSILKSIWFNNNSNKINVFYYCARMKKVISTKERIIQVRFVWYYLNRRYSKFCIFMTSCNTYCNGVSHRLSNSASKSASSLLRKINKYMYVFLKNYTFVQVQPCKDFYFKHCKKKYKLVLIRFLFPYPWFWGYFLMMHLKIKLFL